MHRQQRIQIQKPCKAMNERKQCQIWIDVGENHRKIFIYHQDLAKLWPCCKTNKVKKRRSIPIERWEVKKQHEMLNQHDPNAQNPISWTANKMNWDLAFFIISIKIKTSRKAFAFFFLCQQQKVALKFRRTQKIKINKEAQNKGYSLNCGLFRETYRFWVHREEA